MDTLRGYGDFLVCEQTVSKNHSFPVFLAYQDFFPVRLLLNFMYNQLLFSSTRGFVLTSGFMCLCLDFKQNDNRQQKHPVVGKKQLQQIGWKAKSKILSSTGRGR